MWALDFGLGIGHLDTPDITGLGFNLELKAGVTSALQLGVRTGVRVGNDGKVTRADELGRTFETESYGTDHKTLANPELSLRYALVDSPTLDLALDGRLYIPTEGTNAGIMVAVPIDIHFSPVVRLDTGLFVPIIFNKPTDYLFSFPAHLWFQIDRLALGLITGVRVEGRGGYVSVPIGAGINFGLSRDLDLRTWVLLRDAKSSSKSLGVGVGLEARF
jgi:hypothetical protein